MSYEYLIIPAMLVLAWFSLRRGPKNLPLDWSTLSTFMARPNECFVQPNPPDGGLGADFGIQFHSGTESVKYFVTERPGHKAETLDAWRKGHAGFIITLVNDEVQTLQRIGGRMERHPNLSPQARTVVEGLVKRIREEAEKYRT